MDLKNKIIHMLSIVDISQIILYSIAWSKKFLEVIESETIIV